MLGARHAEAERVVCLAHRVAGVGLQWREAQLRPAAAAALHGHGDLLQAASHGGFGALGAREGPAEAAQSALEQHAQRGASQREARRASLLRSYGKELKMDEHGLKSA